MSDRDLQMAMNFAPERNRFRANVEQGEFTLLIETPVPGPQIPPAEALEQLRELEKAVLDISDVRCGLAILDRNSAPEAWSAVEMAAHLSEENRDRHAVYLSGRNRKPDEVAALLRVAENAGCRNLVPVSGDLDDSSHRTGSGEIFRQITARSKFFAGVTVNPFQYDPWALMAQYYKLAARLQQGAGFFVAQTGWDLLKMQSLSWFLLNRSLFVPAFARLTLLTPDRMEKIASGGQPGVVIPPELRKTQEKELCFSRNQFDAAQLRRLELQVAGCRLLGFNGVQLSGAEVPRLAAVAARRIAGALREFTDFDQFIECYNSEMADSEINTFRLDFHLYDRVLHRPYPFDAPPGGNELPPAELNALEKVGSWFHYHTLTGECRHCAVCRAPERQGVCTPGGCPKHLTYGPCGGVRPDGRCESGEAECVFRKWCRFAAAKDRLPAIEEELMR